MPSNEPCRLPTKSSACTAHRGPQTEERHTAKLGRYRIRVTSDISRALAFAAVQGRNL